MIYVTKETKPSDVSLWDVLYESDTATVWEAENIRDYFKIKFHNTQEVKYYKGESAWMTVQREVVDAGDFGGWSIF